MAGFFGKVPCKGDFVTRGLPAEFVRVWDGWLQRGVATSRDTLGEDWLDVFLGAPIWRFELAPGLAGEVGWAGVWLPSVDRVGRYFPLTIAAPAPGAPSLRPSDASPWYERAEEIAASAVEDESWTLETLEDAIAGLAPLAQEVPPPPRATRLGAGAWLFHWASPEAQAGDQDEGAAALGAALLAQELGDYSLWRTWGSDRVDPVCFACRGLPGPEAFVSMLDGAWSAR